MQSIDEVHARLVRLGEDWAEVNSASELLEETRKSVRAQIALSYLPVAKSMAKAEVMADADGEYQAHIRAMVEAKRKANIAQVNYKAAAVWVDLLRSQESTRRAEMNLK